MKKFYLVLAFVLTFTPATTVFTFGPGSGSGGPSIAGPCLPCPLGFGLYGPAVFFEKPESPGHFPGGPRPGLHGKTGTAQWLNLSAEQMSKMKELADRSFQETRDLRYELFQKDLEMRKLFSNPKTVEADLLAKQKEVNLLHQKLMDKITQTMIEKRKILTTEQIQKLDQMPKCL